MAGFIYYLPGDARLADAATLAAYGLADVFGQGESGEGVMANGPDGGSGLIVRALAGNAETPCGYYPTEQTWRRAGRIWSGVWNNSKPMPATLERADSLASFLLTLSDGQTWKVPSAKALPSYFGVDDDGRMVKRFKGKSRRLSELGELAFRGLTIKDDTIFLNRALLPPQRQHEIAVAALQYNYRVGPVECDTLAIPDTTDRQTILQALADVLGLIPGDGEEESKKNGASGSGSQE